MMIAHLVCAISLLVFYILQSTVFSQMTLISGTVDLVLLFIAAWALQPQVRNSWVWAVLGGLLISLISAMPFYAPLIAYVSIVAVSKLLQRKVWRIPILAMLIVTILGSFLQHFIYIIALQINGTPISLIESVDKVILPSVLLNIIIAIPIFAIASELAGRIYPLEMDV
jgi:rod shape-determining protein MreD